MTFKDSTKEVIKIAIGTLALTVVMWIAFVIFGYFSYKVIIGGLVGTITATLNFALLALTLELSLGKGARKAQGMMGLSYTLRLVIIALIVVFSIKSPHINYIAVVIPLIFPRIVITMLNAFKKSKKEDKSERTEDNL